MSEEGSSDLVSAIVVLVVLAAVAQVFLDVDLLGYVEAAVDWVAGLIGRVSIDTT